MWLWICVSAPGRGHSQTERVHRPAQVCRLLVFLQRQTFPERGLIHLDHTYPCRLQVRYFIPDRQGKLIRDLMPRDIVPHERPVEHGDRSGEHAFHGTTGQGLGEFQPVHGHRKAAEHIAVDHRRLDRPAAIAHHPAIFQEKVPVELLAEILHHIVALEFPVHQYIQAYFLLERDQLANVLPDRVLVLLLRHLALLHAGAQAADVGSLRETADRGCGHQRQTELFALETGALGVRLGPAETWLIQGLHPVTHGGRETQLTGEALAAGLSRPFQERTIHLSHPAIQAAGQGDQLFHFFPGERQHGEHLIREVALRLDSHRHVLQGTARTEHKPVRAEQRDKLRVQSLHLIRVRYPDIVPIHHSGEQKLILGESLTF